MSRFTDFKNLDGFGEQRTVCWDFTDDLNSYPTAGVTLTGSPTLTITVVTGTDSAPTSRIIVAPEVGTARRVGAITNGAILAMLGNLVPGVEYLLALSCALTDGGTATAYNHISGSIPS